MTIGDYDAAVALWKNTEGMGLSQADSRPNVERFLQRNPDMSFVAWNAEKLVGAVMCGHDGRRGFLYHLAVAASARRSGIGKALVDRCLDRLSELGMRKCHLFVLGTNVEGKRFWKHTGWQERLDLVVMSHDVPESNSGGTAG